jgi:hypothetical protein
MTTKADIINDAYSIIRISGLTVDPSADDLTLALGRLESMAAEFFGRNIKVGYNFENTPSTASLHNMERMYWYPFAANLAVRLLSDFGKPVPPVLAAMQQSTFSFLSSSTALVRAPQYPTRMPRGEGNTRRTYRWRRFFTRVSEAPLSAKTNVMYIGDVMTYSESFAAYLDAGETISSYTITANTGLTISADANADPLITYTITATGLSDGNAVSLLQVQIIITTSSGRKETRIINFELLDPDIT